jgi:L-lactate dehydrogenase complex protein LldG
MDRPYNLGTPKEIFLESIRTALRRTEGPPDTRRANLIQTKEELQELANSIELSASKNRDALSMDLAHTASLGGWNVYTAHNNEDVLNYINTVASKWSTTTLSRSDQPVFSNYPIDTGLIKLGYDITTITHNNESAARVLLRENIIASGIGITGADYAVAETGSIVLMPRAGISRLVSVVPPVHIALVRKQDILSSIDDVLLLRRLDHYNNGDMGSYLNFITGPSRTADIEQTIVVGVHGPKEVHMVLLD